MVEIPTEALEAGREALDSVWHNHNGIGWQPAYDDRDLLADAAVAAAAPHLIAEGRRQAEAELAEAYAKIDRLVWGQTYEPDGRCRRCRARPGPDWKPGQPTDPGNTHRMDCPLYVGPLTHRWLRQPRLNGTFGGFDYDCACGGWFRQGGLAGHGDDAACPNVDQSWRGPQPEAVDHV